MPDESQDVRCVQLTIFLSTDNPVVAPTFFAAAGDNHDEVVQQPPRFQTSELKRAKTVCIQLLEKLAKAASAGAETINIHVADGGIIVPDPAPVAITADSRAVPPAPVAITTGARAAPKPKKAAAKARPKASPKAAKPLQSAATPKIEKKTDGKKKTQEMKKSEPKKTPTRTSKTDGKKKTVIQTKTMDKKKATSKKQPAPKTKASPPRKNRKTDRNR
jgi:hypothetical protein